MAASPEVFLFVWVGVLCFLRVKFRFVRIRFRIASSFTLSIIYGSVKHWNYEDTVNAEVVGDACVCDDGFVGAFNLDFAANLWRGIYQKVPCPAFSSGTPCKCSPGYYY